MLSFFKTSLKRGIRIRDEVVRSDTWVQRKAWLWLFILIDEESFCASGILRYRMEKATIHVNLYVLALSEYQTNQLTRKKKEYLITNYRRTSFCATMEVFTHRDWCSLFPNISAYAKLSIGMGQEILSCPDLTTHHQIQSQSIHVQVVVSWKILLALWDLEW